MKHTAILLLLILLASCTKTVYVPVESRAVSTDSAYRAVYVDRLVVEKDTVNTYLVGDTVVREVTRWRIKETEKHDTIRETHTDSIEVSKPYPVEVIREVEKKLKWWQKGLMWVGAGCFLYLLISACRHYYKS